MALTNAAAGFIGASVTLVLVIIFMILMVILVRQCLAFISKRNAIRAQVDHQRQIREQIRQRRGSVTEPIPATFDWHHSIRIAGTPPPSYGEAKTLPAFEENTTDGSKGKKTSENVNEAAVDPQDTKFSAQPEANGVAPLLQEVVVQVEENGGNVGVGVQGSRGEGDRRTFTTGYTEFTSA